MGSPTPEQTDQSIAAAHEIFKRHLKELLETPAPFYALQTASMNLIASSYAMILNGNDPKIGDMWMLGLLNGVKEALKQSGLEVTFSFARK